jgi:hypothetical protein
MPRVMSKASVAFSAAVAALLLFLASCHFVDPFVWWQEVVCTHTTMWLPLVLVLFVLELVRFFRGVKHPLLSLVVLVVAATLIGFSLSRAWPYWSYTHTIKLAKDEAIAVGVFHAHVGPSEQEALLFEKTMKELAPEVLVLHGDRTDLVEKLRVSERLRYSVRGGVAGPSSIQLYSAYPLGSDTRADFGVEALPAIYSQLYLEPDVVFELGVVSLVESTSNQSFQLARVTSRRMASITRNSITPRMIVGDFSATPFSRIVSTYDREARVRSVFSGQGIQSWWKIQGLVKQSRNVNAFVSAGITVNTAVVISDLHPTQRSLFAVVHVPRITIIPTEK